MNLANRTLAAVALAAAALVSAPANAATTFTFGFDQQGFAPGDGPLVGALAGTGTFVSPTDLAAGTYDLSSLSGFSLSFSFNNGSTFNKSNIATPLTGAAVRIVDLLGGGQRLFFTEGSGAGQDSGPQGGALDLVNGDLVNGSNTLSFEPSYAGGNFLYAQNGAFGRYLATSATAVPEPATWAMVILGMGAVGFVMRRRTKGVTTTVKFA